MPIASILVLCTGNSARSQMGEGILRSLDPRLEVHSAGTLPAARVHPAAVEAMREIGIDIAGAAPKSVERFLARRFDHLITVCGEADRACPTFQGLVRRRVHMGFEDPARATGCDAEVLAAFRGVRDQIRARLTEYYNKEIHHE